MAAKFPAKAQSDRVRQRLPLGGSCQSRQALTEGVPVRRRRAMDFLCDLRLFGEKAVGGFDFLSVFM